MKLEFVLNREPVSLEDVPGHWSLLELLRRRLGLLGVKEGCGVGECGACTVLLDGRAVNACLTAAGQVAGREVLTIEGLARGNELHPLQEAFMETGAVQCGFCTPGMIMSAWGLLQENPHPRRQDIETALAGNLCRCTGYGQIVQAVELAAARLRGEKP